jgi:23S rRNA (adenine2503-C2)-methyltransferase
MNIQKLKEILSSQTGSRFAGKNQPQFRFKQCYKAVFFDFLEDWNDASVLPLELRNKLNEKCPLEIKSEFSESQNKKTIKTLVILEDDSKIEAVLMRHGNRNTVCVSSQVGCPLACEFCATGKMGFVRNLSSAEIIEQVLVFSRYLKKYDEKVTNIVFMGMGEPFLNYEEVMKAIQVLNDQQAFNIGARHISISTAGLVEGIQRLSKERLQVNLAVSLHASNDQLRSELMPINNQYSLKLLFKAVDDYIQETNRRVMFEYLLIQGVNDSEKQALELAQLMKNNKLYMVNLISYNPTGKFKPSDSRTINKFMEILIKERVNFTQRYKFGRDIQGACGQLALKQKMVQD